MKRSLRRTVPVLLGLIFGVGAAWFWSGRERMRDSAAQVPGPTISPPSSSASRLTTSSFVPQAIGNLPEGQPWITDLTTADLDRDGLVDVIACEGRLNRVIWIRQVTSGVFEEQLLGESIAGPAHVEVSDLNADGHLDVLVASMGIIPPSNAKTGAVVVLENDGANKFINRVLLQDVARVTYVAAADLNKDGLPDLVVGQFGYLEGELRWMENRGKGQFVSHSLLDLPGSIHSPIVDYDRDGNLDIVALVSQDAEEVHGFAGDGTGRFRDRVLHGSVNKDFGSSGLTVADVNRDGLPDIVYTNGDGFDYATPGSRPWHGVQWLENTGGGKFAFHRVGDFPGSYSPVVVDIDGDGDNDIVASSGFNDWKNHTAVSLVCFENDGQERFTARPLAQAPTHLIVVKAADFDNDGRMELVTGGFAFYPPYDRVGRVTLWTRKP